MDDLDKLVLRVIEECGELLQALGKAQRFGWFNFHPDRPEATNMYDVRQEMCDVWESIECLDVRLRHMNYEHHQDQKKEKNL